MNVIDQNPSVDLKLHPLIYQHGVMVVDDSELQRSVAVETLKTLGIDSIYEASDGMQALEMLRSGSASPAVLIVDLEMPGLNGIELIQHLSTEHHQIAVIIASGVDIKLLDTLEEMVIACNMPMLGALPKPLDGNKLLRSLRRFQPVQPARNPPVQEAAMSVGDLREAIRHGRLVPFYQPKVSLKTSRIVGYEALARMRNSDGKLITPASFIHVAEQNGLIYELTLSMLQSILNDMNIWRKQGLTPLVSINITIRLFEDHHFVKQIISCVERSGLLPTNFILEITESALMQDQAAALLGIGHLRLKGFGLSIDDYGTGFSSMQQLTRIAFSELKLDQSFVHGANERVYLRTILQSAIEMGQRLGLKTVAEGVESIEELNLLKEIGCDEIQGYLFAKPMPATEVYVWQNQNTDRIAQLCASQPTLDK